MHHGFAGGFHHVILQTLDEGVGGLAVGGISAEKSLVQEVLFVCVRNALAVYVGFVNGVEFGPALQVRVPLIGNFGEHIDARAYVLAALGVVGGCSIHAVRPVGLTLGEEIEELLAGSGSGGLRISSHLIEGRQGMVDVERCVFHA